jgi:hypothetical protein
MTINVRKYASVVCVAGINLVALTTDIRAQSTANIQLNENAFSFAAEIIKAGHVVVDGKGRWRYDKPSADAENAFIRAHGFAEYAKWHLGVDSRFAENTKRRYKFPFGDFTNVHRCGLLAVKSRAHQYGYTYIEEAAAKLERVLKVIRPAGTDSHKLRDPFRCRVTKSSFLALPGG